MRFLTSILLIVVVYLTLSEGTKVRYDDYQIWSLKIDTNTQLELLQSIEIRPDGVSISVTLV